MEWLVKLKLVLPYDTAVPLILDSRAAASQAADPGTVLKGKESRNN